MENITQLTHAFNQNGFVLIKHFFTPEEIATLIADIKETAGQKSDDDVLDVGNLKFHALLMHRSEKLRQFISQPKVVDFLTHFMGPDIWVRWDQAVEKRPGAGTFPWHQDNSYSGLIDAHFQFWVSLTKMTKDNGGIWLIPGSHKKNLKHRIDGRHTVYEVNGEEEHFVSAEIGDIVLFSSKMLHSTTPNITQESRWAYVVEYMKGADVDPFIEPPHLMIAKNGKPAMQYVNELPAAKKWGNQLKYLTEHLKGKTYAAKQKAKQKALT